MKRIYIITREGKAWGQEGYDWIENEYKPSVNETDETTAVQGMFYNNPKVLLNELERYPDSYVILSYEYTDVFEPGSISGICEELQEHIDLDDHKTSWEILKNYSNILLSINLN